MHCKSQKQKGDIPIFHSPWDVPHLSRKIEMSPVCPPRHSLWKVFGEALPEDCDELGIPAIELVGDVQHHDF